jgi:Na+/proline symporter
MLQSWMIFFFGLAYLGGLFAVATWGDRPANRRKPGSPRPFIYALSLGVYCTSWTYFGSVGIASRSGYDFLPIYIGPILVFALGWPLLQRIAEIAKRQNIASIADFLSARYGKSEALGALVAAVATIGVVPYISIQLKAVSQSLQTMITDPLFPEAIMPVIKLVAFVAVGLFVTLSMMGGFEKLADHVTSDPHIYALLANGLSGTRWLTLTLLAAIAIILLPRQFHVAVVENAAPLRHPPRRLAVSALPRRHQYLRHPHRHCRPHFSSGKCGWRHVRAGPSGQRPEQLLCHGRLHRRPLGFHRHGCC